MAIKEKELKFVIWLIMWVIVIGNFLFLIGFYLHKRSISNKKIKSKETNISSNELHTKKQITGSKKSNPEVTKDTESSSPKKQTVNADPSSEEKENTSNWKKLSSGDKWIICFFWAIALYELAGILGVWNCFSINKVLSALAILAFGWDLFHIENINTSEDQKRINNFFEILILSIILSTIIIFVIPGFSFNIKLAAAIDLFKLCIGSTLLGLVIGTMQDDSMNFTLGKSLISILALCTIFVSYSNFTVMEKNLDNTNNSPSIKDFQKIVAHSKKSDLKRYNDIINKALKNQKSTSRH